MHTHENPGGKGAQIFTKIPGGGQGRPGEARGGQERLGEAGEGPGGGCLRFFGQNHIGSTPICVLLYFLTSFSKNLPGGGGGGPYTPLCASMKETFKSLRLS
jgi:hypothetical protein